jgi:hypothetical protein
MKVKFGNGSDTLSARKDNARVPHIPALLTRRKDKEIEADGEHELDNPDLFTHCRACSIFLLVYPFFSIFQFMTNTTKRTCVRP